MNSTWLEDMIEKPPFINSRDFEYQVRNNMLIPEAEMIRDSEAGPKPVLLDQNSNAQKKCHGKAVAEWDDRNDVLFFNAMQYLRVKNGLAEGKL